jgi:hypothetical protein
MSRRFDTNYRVKPKDNLGDPEYWNRRFEDVDRRIDSSESALESLNEIEDRVQSIALERLNLVLAPALSQIAFASDQGFLMAHSNSVITLTDGSTVTFTIDDAGERSLFAPSPFIAITRSGSIDDYAFARRISYSKTTGELVAELVTTYGSPGPFSDWEINVGAGVNIAVASALASVLAARDTAISNAGTSTTERIAAQAARTAAETAKTSAESALASFAAVYYGARATEPAGALIGSFYFDTDDQVFKVLGTGGWAPGITISLGGVVSQNYTATGGQTAFTVDGGFTNIDVFKNGTQLKPTTDYTFDVTAGTFTLTSGATAGNWIAARGYKATNSIDFYTKSAADDLLNTKYDKTGGLISGAVSTSGSNAITAGGDLKAGSGKVILSADNVRFMQWTGTVYRLGGTGGGDVWHSGNFDPATKLDKAGGTVAGNVTVTGTLAVNNNVVWHAGNFTPGNKVDVSTYNSFLTSSYNSFVSATNTALAGKQAALGFPPVQSGGISSNRTALRLDWRDDTGTPQLYVDTTIVDLPTQQWVLNKGYKTFVIQHPVEQDLYLVHACLEGPEVAVFYRGKSELIDGRREIELPDYFAALADEDSATISITPIASDTIFPVLAASEVSNGRFTVFGTTQTGRFHWEVKATRKDGSGLIVEPKKSDVTLHGDGPYTYYQTR